MFKYCDGKLNVLALDPDTTAMDYINDFERYVCKLKTYSKTWNEKKKNFEFKQRIIDNYYTTEKGNFDDSKGLKQPITKLESRNKIYNWRMQINYPKLVHSKRIVILFLKRQVPTRVKEGVLSKLTNNRLFYLFHNF